MASPESPASKPLTRAELMHKLAKAGPSPIKLQHQGALLAILDQLALGKGLTPAQRADKLWAAFAQVARSARTAVLTARRKQRIEQERRDHGVKHARSSRNTAIAPGNPKEESIAQEAEQAEIAAAGELLGLSDDQDLTEMLDAQISHYRQIEEKCRTRLETRKVRASVWFGGAIYADLAERKAVKYWWPAFLGAVERQLMIDRSNDSTSPAIDRNAAEQLARLIPMAPIVQQALDHAKAACEMANKQFFTPNLLLALLEIPHSEAARCFDALGRPGLVSRLTSSLRKYINGTQFPEFKPFGWVERDDVARAQDLAQEVGSRVINEVHLLLGILDSEQSVTRVQLAAHLGADFDRLRQIAHQAAMQTLHRRTPGTWEPEDVS